MRLLGFGLLLLAILNATASARPAADDLTTIVFLSQGTGVTQVQGLTFGLVIEVEGTAGVQRAVTVRATLPSGLAFATPPGASDGCSGIAPSLVCTKAMAVDGAGTARASWRWQMQAAGPGSYTVSATASSDEPDPNAQNNTGTLQFEVLTEPRLLLRLR